LMFPA